MAHPPEHAVFDLPRRPNHAVQALSVGGGHPWEGAKRVAPRHTVLCSKLPDRFPHDHTGEPRPARTRAYAHKRFGAPHPTRLDPPVATVELFSLAQGDGVIAGMCAPEPYNQVVTIAVQARLMCFSAQHVIRALRLNLSGALPLAPHGIAGHPGSGQIAPKAPLGQDGDLVGFGVNFERRQHQLMG